MYFQLHHLFAGLNRVFPLSTMSENFKGSHSITYQDAIPELMVWANGRAFRFGLEPADVESFEAIEKLIANLRVEVDAILASKKV